MKFFNGLSLSFAILAATTSAAQESERLLYNNPGLVVDLGVGLWAEPIPVDFDGDGDHDLVVGTSDRPYNGLYFFENTEGDVKFPVFKPGKRLGPAGHNITISHNDQGWFVMTPGKRYPDFRESALENGEPIPFEGDFPLKRGRAKQWKTFDYNGDGVLDIVFGGGEWVEYGWDDAYDDNGNWTNGPIHGYVFVAINEGTNEAPSYAKPEHVMTKDGPVDVFGAPSPNLADWDGDGDLDLICGEFLDRISYFENIGTRTEPLYSERRFLKEDGEIVHMDLQMLQVISMDWDKDGDTDLIVGQEDGRVALMEFTGTVADGAPVFKSPRFFEQEAHELKIGALCTPYSFDWDGDGDEDLIAGDTAGYINFVENLDGGNPPKWAEPVYLEADGEVIRKQAGLNGSIQGPAEAKWGYTVLNVADWNHDGLPDIVINSIWGKVEWFENVGTREEPKLKAAQPVQVAWRNWNQRPLWFWWEPEGNNLVTQWRTTPLVIDLNEDGLDDLVMLDYEGYLSFFERTRRDDKLLLLEPKRIFHDDKGHHLRLNNRWAGGSGRRKFTMTDWDGDGKLDLLVNSRSIDLLRNAETQEGASAFVNEGLIDQRVLAGHTTCPTVVNWDGDGVPDLVIGAEDGFLYYLRNPRGN